MTNVQNRIKQIVDSRIFRAAPSVKRKFPQSISDASGFFVNFGNEKLHVILFLQGSEKKNLENRIQKGYDPFPGLLTMDEGGGAAFRFENSKNCVIESCQVKNSYLLSLGENSSIVLIDQKQEINTAELGVVSYTIDLGFIISFPGKGSPFDLGDAFDDLVSYYVGSRREKT